MEIVGQVLKWVLILAPWFYAFHNTLYSKNPRYYFAYVRLFSKWRDTNWSVNANYTLQNTEGVYANIEKVLKASNRRYNRTVNMKNKKLYECGIYNILVQDDFQDGNYSRNQLFVKVSQLNVTLNTAEEKLNDLRRMFNEIERGLFIVDKGYNLDIFFKEGSNPFYGLMVQRLGKENVKHFECFFPISSIVPGNYSGQEKFLRIYKEKLCINESTFDIVEETARKALLFK